MHTLMRFASSSIRALVHVYDRRGACHPVAPRGASDGADADAALPPELGALVLKTIRAHGLDEKVARRILAVVRTQPPEEHQLAIQRILESAV